MYEEMEDILAKLDMGRNAPGKGAVTLWNPSTTNTETPLMDLPAEIQIKIW